MTNRSLTNAALSLSATLMTLIALELSLRVYHGSVFDFSPQVRPTPNRLANPRAEYDSLLGWVPAPGANDAPGIETVTGEGLRSNGSDVQRDGPVLAVGDSYTFGAEVADSATWPSHLERALGVPVVNGGVFAYGLDQAYLRTQGLLDAHDPDVVVLAFIRHDVNRTELSYYSAWKPFFELDQGELTLSNVPVPRSPPPEPRLAWLRTASSRSFLASALARRYAAGWWSYGAVHAVHSDGLPLATELVARLDATLRARGVRLLVVALSTAGRIGSNADMPDIVDGMRGRGVEVLDLVSEIADMIRDDPDGLVMPRGHYSSQLNRWVAERVAVRLESLAPGLRKAGGDSDSRRSRADGPGADRGLGTTRQKLSTSASR